jgi:hypothetical protein
VDPLIALIWPVTVFVDVLALVPLATDPRSSFLLDFPRYVRLDVYPDASQQLLAAGCTLIAVAVSIASHFYQHGQRRSRANTER